MVCRYAVQAMTSAYALYDFATKHNTTAQTWSADVKKTYPVAHSGQFMLWAAAMITWAHRCENTKLPLCNDNKARRWLAIAEQEWDYQVVRITTHSCRTALSVSCDAKCLTLFILATSFKSKSTKCHWCPLQEVAVSFQFSDHQGVSEREKCGICLERDSMICRQDNPLGIKNTCSATGETLTMTQRWF
jgi:hypothetical protein